MVRHGLRVWALAGAAAGALAAASAAKAQVAAPGAPPTPVQDAGSPAATPAPEAAPERGLAEVVVTAQKRSQSIERVPASIQVQTGATIAAYQQPSLRSIALTIPNLVLTASPSGSVSANIRGFGTPTANAGFEQTVALFIDGVYSPRPQSYSGAIFDVDRIEVVKGTQGTLFGKNAEVGGISLVTRNPQSTFGGFIDTGYDFLTDGKRVEAGVDLPVNSKLKLRVSGLYDDESEGWLLNRATGSKQPTSLEYAGRAKLIWDATDNLSFNAKVEFNRLSGDGDTLFGVGGPLFAGVTDNNAVKNASSNLIPENGGQDYRRRRSDVESIGFNWRIAGLTVTDITSWQKLNFRTAADFDQTTGPFDFVNYFYEQFRQFSQELRVASNENNRFSYIAGVFYLNQDLSNGLNTRFAPAPATNLLTIKDEVESGFAQGAFKVTDRLTLTAGGRVTHEEKDGSLAVTKKAGSATTLQTIKDDSFDWSLVGEYQAFGRTTVYATVSRGHKAPGALNSVPGAAIVPASLFIAGETATNYEVGVKSRFLDGRARGSLALYHLDVDNFQGSEFNPVLASFVTSNIDARAQGVEANLQVRIFPELTIDVSGAYNDGTVRATGNQLISAPKFNGTVGANYTRPINDAIEFQAGGQFSYTTKYPNQFDLNPYNFTQEHPNLDARIGVRLVKTNITLSLVGKNLTNAHYTEFAFGNPAAPNVSFDHQINRPRSFILSASAKF